MKSKGFTGWYKLIAIGTLMFLVYSDYKTSLAIQRTINEIHNHNKCDSTINYQQGFIEYFKLEHPEVDLIEAREYSRKNK